ncbi:TPA: hypothetical protein ACS73L_002186 [Providencia alcalifaciens]
MYANDKPIGQFTPNPKNRAKIFADFDCNAVFYRDIARSSPFYFVYRPIKIGPFFIDINHLIHYYCKRSNKQASMWIPALFDIMVYHYFLIEIEIIFSKKRLFWCSANTILGTEGTIEGIN